METDLSFIKNPRTFWGRLRFWAKFVAALFVIVLACILISIAVSAFGPVVLLLFLGSGTAATVAQLISIVLLVVVVFGLFTISLVLVFIVLWGSANAIMGLNDTDNLMGLFFKE